MMSKKTKRMLLVSILVQPFLIPCITHAEPLEDPVTDVNASQAGDNPANEQANLQLLEAVKSKDSAKVHQALQEGADVNFRFKKGRTALFKAIKYNDIKIIELLLQNGADVNAKDDAGNTPLIYSAKKGKFKAVQLLLYYGANTEEQNKAGKKAIAVAKSEESREIVDIIKENQDFYSSLGLFVDMRGRDMTLDRFRAVAIKAFETRNWQNISANNNQVSGIYETSSRLFKSTMIYEPDQLIIKFEPAMGYRKPYYLESLRTVFFQELENQ
jgi:ankyrin repeat protein